MWGYLKRNWQKLLTEHSRKTKGKAIDKVLFPKLIKQLTDTTKKHQFQNGFQKVGLYPIPSAAAIDESKIIPLEPHKKRLTPSKTPHPKTVTPQQ
jgi:hypothetical protein